MNTEDNNVCPDDLSTPKLSTYSTSPPLPPPPPPLPPSSNSPPATSLHANLMQAIRTAGGTRKAKLRCVDATPESDNNMIVAPPSGDLMSDLAAKLQLRRKGISGSHNQMNENSTSSGNLMDKLLHNIPPPLAAGSSESDHDDTDTEPDWDD
ncbi:WASH complex subunit 1-like [Diaphorina citri]|jgi:hypothetical protein|uniref:WASH complex subunit 1-like n=1 Tax=Diaphorina citri TaxID=121845 RepID=A0A3Q0J5S0_DIACI|nr:WASH complex subunit 1-like [Diaphorina citri]KAI5753919.1 hypothetical protein M8J77_004339 [Diaphorina citri]